MMMPGFTAEISLRNSEDYDASVARAPALRSIDAADGGVFPQFTCGQINDFGHAVCPGYSPGARYCRRVILAIADC